ncbi:MULTISPECIES: phage terminase small subunit P27 family [Pectobacterium]|uniref:Terminase n=2 Tax=Pectobacterium TaxID=122277 RepID=A0AAW3ENM5_9GAMM|nr:MULTISPECIES: phage terminase small subunit P27 family [Pectobacterium]EJS96276.1 Putative phage terminase, small subunit, P27 family protein [Pectobacterium wasabiae CFBP 3304]KFX09880.1 terminase [Pectobacterium wasabiae]KGA30082.1 terminase [Pectobacterium wasabiae]KGA39389.1 terminase [Pectobacterium odoriferum]MCA6962430.1 phage terminase small subunit P27 family [Pectobacterium odoriferum]
MGTSIRASGGGRKQKVGTKNKSSLTRIAPPPELMSDTAIRMWKTQSKILIERGTFELEDAPLLLAYCNSFHLMITAEKVITKQAEIDLENMGLADLGGTGGLKKHPAVAVRNDCVSQLARLGSLLGLDPLSRIRMIGGTEGDEEENEFDEF